MMIVNCPTKELTSEVGHIIAHEYGIGMVWWFDHETQMANVSLRSVGDHDVSKIAVKYGGGGHRAASGFTIDLMSLLDL